MAHATDLHDIYLRYGPALLRKAQRMLQNHSDAEDLVQGLFVDLLGRGELPRDLPYLYRALTHRCLNLMRDQRNRDRLLEAQRTTLRGPVRLRCDDRVIGVDMLLKLAAKLDRKSWEILVYRYVDDLTQEEIAAMLGTSRKTVGKRLRKIEAAVTALAQGGAP